VTSYDCNFEFNHKTGGKPQGSIQVMKKRRIRNMALALVILVIASILFCTFAPRYQAKRFLKAFLALQVGQSGFSDAELVAKSFHGQILTIGDVAPECSPAHCSYVFYFQNTMLHRLRLAPRVAFSAVIETTNDKLVLRRAALASETNGKYAEAFTLEERENHSGQSFRRAVYSFVPQNGFEMTPSASAKQRALAYSFNLACLSKIGGCSRPTEMLPALANTDFR